MSNEKLQIAFLNYLDYRLSATPYALTASQAGGKLSSYEMEVPKEEDLSQRQCHFCTEVVKGVAMCPPSSRAA